MKPKLSLVTGTVNRPDGIARLVQSVIENTAVSWELVISDASEVPFESVHPSVRVIHEKPRLGYVRGYNAAFREAVGEWVIYLNDDAVVLPNYDTKAIEFMEANPHVGLGCLAFSDRCWNGFEVQRFWGIPYANFGIIRRELGNSLGWFWEELRMYGSDNALTFDVLLAGYAVAPIQGEFIHHFRANDRERAANQVGRETDSRRLSAKYGHRKQELRDAFYGRVRA